MGDTPSPEEVLAQQSSRSNTSPDTLESHCREQLAINARAYTFDMEDEPEQPCLANFGVLRSAIDFLGGELKKSYSDADREAMEYQHVHRRLAQIAILSGTLAVMLAIFQLGLLQTNPKWSAWAAWLEVIAIAAGVLAVAVGLKAKSNRNWFIKRHVAERLRMLKFQSLGQANLWCGSFSDWKAWVTEQMGLILQIDDIRKVEEWAESGAATCEDPILPKCTIDDATLRACSDYYRWKRVEFQAAYFDRQARKYRRDRPLLRVGLPLFFLTIGAVLVHIISHRISLHMAHTQNEDLAKVWEFVGLWALVLAAMLPVVSLCVRAWLGAFEHIRSASLFQAKYHALRSISGQLERDLGSLPHTMYHIAHVEHFLEHEHREWLRLLLEAEWFL